MNLEEIVNRTDALPIEQHEALFVIKKYLKAFAGVDVEPFIEGGGALHILSQVKKMTSMSRDYIAWFRERPHLL